MTDACIRLRTLKEFRAAMNQAQKRNTQPSKAELVFSLCFFIGVVILLTLS